MKKLMTLTALFLFVSSGSLFSQCPSGDANFFTQSDIHAFVAAFPDCAQFDGNITIGKPGGPSDIYDLSGLIHLTDIGGYLRIMENPNLASLNGLQNLEFVGGDLVITNCPALTSTDGFDHLSHIGGILSFSYLENLNSFQGMGNLEDIGKDFSLYLTPSVINFNGFSSLNKISGSFIIDHNNGLVSLKGLESLKTIGIDLVVKGNASLIRLEGLEGLTSIGNDLRIGWEYVDGNVGNPSLSNLDGLVNLVSIGGAFKLVDNDALASLGGMASLNFIGGKVDILHNAILSMCAIEPICAYLADGGSANIEDNAGDCEDLGEVFGACQLSTGTDNLSAEGVISLQPNPASGRVSVVCDSRYAIDRIGIYTLTGKEVFGAANPGTQIDLAGLPAGIYLVRVQAGGKYFLQRLVVQ